MRIFLSAIIFSLLAVFSEHVMAQDLLKDEIVVIQGEKYISHQVRTGETLYSITKRYNIDQALLEKLNPKVKGGLNLGDMLKIPYKEGVGLSQRSADQKDTPDGFTTYKIKSRKETPYSIAKKHDITVEELYAYNSRVKKYKKNVKVKIPFWNVVKSVEEEIVTQVSEGLVAHQVISGETLYSLARKYGVTENELLKQNPAAVNLKAGMTIYIPAKRSSTPGETKPEALDKPVGINYLEHIIESGETMWGTTRKYGISEAELKALNPILNTGFPAGVVIRIPVLEVEKTLARPVNEAAFTNHMVEKKETLYGLSKKYGLSIPEIKKFNPVLETRNLVAGETVLIPAKPDEIFEQIVRNNIADSARLVEEYYEVELPLEIPQSCLPDSRTMFTDKTYTIALFLPLFLEANDTLNLEDAPMDTMELFSEEEVEIAQDTTIEMEERKELFKQFYGGSENFLQFYEGVLLAADSLQKAGVHIRLNVFDTQRNADSIRQYMESAEFLMTDLIIGPIYQQVQKEVADYAAKNRIPLVSPLASQSEITAGNPSYYQVNPSHDYVASRTAEMVAEEYYNSNFVIVKTRNYEGTQEGKLVEMFKEKFVNSGFMSDNEGVNFTIYDFENEGGFGLSRIMSKSKENVVYIPSLNEGELSIAISNVNNLSREYSITLIGSSRFDNFASIQVDHFHNLKLKYIDPYWVDYTNPATIGFVEEFKENFSTEPNNFAMQGYDVTMYFMTALTAFGSEFSDCLPYLHLNQVQGNYHFEKISRFGGYMNQGVSVVSYTKNYEVHRKRIKGQPRLMAGN